MGEKCIHRSSDRPAQKRRAAPVQQDLCWSFARNRVSVLIAASVHHEAVLSSTSSPELAAVTKPTVDPRLVASLASVYVIWASTYLAIRIAVHELPPLLS